MTHHPVAEGEDHRLETLDDITRIEGNLVSFADLPFAARSIERRWNSIRISPIQVDGEDANCTEQLLAPLL